MKLLLFATTALAASPMLSSRSADSEQLVAGFDSINDAVQNLATEVKSAQGPEQANALIAASKKVLDSIKAVFAKVQDVGAIEFDDALSLTHPITSLKSVTEEAVAALLGKKQLIIDSGRGCEVLPQLEAQKTQTKALTEAIFPKIPEDLLPIARDLASGISAVLEKGIAEFKDVVCASTPASSATDAASTPAPTPEESSSSLPAVDTTVHPSPVAPTDDAAGAGADTENTPAAKTHPLAPTTAAAVQTAHPAANNGTKTNPDKMDKGTDTETDMDTEEPEMDFEDSFDTAVPFPKGTASPKSPYDAAAGGAVLKPSGSRDYPGYVPRPSTYIPSSSSSSSSSGGKSGQKSGGDNEPITPPIITSGSSQGNNVCFGIAVAGVLAAVGIVAAM